MRDEGDAEVSASTKGTKLPAMYRRATRSIYRPTSGVANQDSGKGRQDVDRSAGLAGKELCLAVGVVEHNCSPLVKGCAVGQVVRVGHA